MEPCIAETDGEGGAVGPDPGLAYPNNLSLGNLASFLPKPTLVYQPSYPRSTRLRPRWLLWCAPRSTPLHPLKVSHLAWISLQFSNAERQGS